jgi:hypothetical protein
VTGLKTRVDRRGGVERDNRLKNGLLGREYECLTERLEPPFRPIHADDDARENAHPAGTLSPPRPPHGCRRWFCSVPE